MEYMEGGSLYEWLHSDLDIGWNVRLKYDKTQSIPYSFVESSISYPIDENTEKKITRKREEREHQRWTKIGNTGWPSKQLLV